MGRAHWRHLATSNDQCTAEMRTMCQVTDHFHLFLFRLFFRRHEASEWQLLRYLGCVRDAVDLVFRTSSVGGAPVEVKLRQLISVAVQRPALHSCRTPSTTN